MLVVSNIFYFHHYLGKIPILTNIFEMGWNHQLAIFLRTRNNNETAVFKLRILELKPRPSFVGKGGDVLFLSTETKAYTPEKTNRLPLRMVVSNRNLLFPG